MIDNRLIRLPISVRIFTFVLLWGIALEVAGQNSTSINQFKITTGSINFGMKAGFNSTMLNILSMTIDGEEVTEYFNSYRIGYLSSAFMRINVGNHFFQPELAYSISNGEVIPEREGNTQPIHMGNITSSIRISTHNIHLPLIYGYHIVKKGPYGMALFAGPQLNYLIKRPNQLEILGYGLELVNGSTDPWGVGITAGIAVNISRIFFDFRFDTTINNLSKSLYANSTDTENLGKPIPISLKQQQSALSFSLGLMF